MKIVCLKLSSGEELIARIVEGPQMLFGSSVAAPDPFAGDGPYTVPVQDILIEKANILGVHQVSPGQVGVGFSPWAIGDQDGKFLLNRDHVTAIYSPVKELEDAFLQQVTGIQLAKHTPTFKAPLTRM